MDMQLSFCCVVICFSFLHFRTTHPMTAVHMLLFFALPRAGNLICPVKADFRPPRQDGEYYTLSPLQSASGQRKKCSNVRIIE